MVGISWATRGLSLLWAMLYLQNGAQAKSIQSPALQPLVSEEGNHVGRLLFQTEFWCIPFNLRWTCYTGVIECNCGVRHTRNTVVHHRGTEYNYEDATRVLVHGIANTYGNLDTYHYRKGTDDPTNRKCGHMMFSSDVEAPMSVHTRRCVFDASLLF
ncbi:uncharacterized protein LOC144161564 [Haemaphysalis longicornis]